MKVELILEHDEIEKLRKWLSPHMRMFSEQKKAGNNVTMKIPVFMDISFPSLDTALTVEPEKTRGTGG